MSTILESKRPKLSLRLERHRTTLIYLGLLFVWMSLQILWKVRCVKSVFGRCDCCSRCHLSTEFFSLQLYHVQYFFGGRRQLDPTGQDGTGHDVCRYQQCGRDCGGWDRHGRGQKTVWCLDSKKPTNMKVVLYIKPPLYTL